MQQASPVAPNYGAQPFPTGSFGGQQFGVQNSIPQVPSNAKISTSGNPAAFMGQAQAGFQVPAAPVTASPAAPATPAFAATPAPMAAPVQTAAPGFGSIQPSLNVAPAAQPAPAAAPAYVPPAAPPVSQPVTQFAAPAAPAAPQAGPVPVVETTDDDDLPF
jgi:hypothetical protein